MESAACFVALVVTPHVFVQVTLKMLTGDRVIDATDTALHEGPKALDSIGVHVTANVLVLAVFDGPVRGEISADNARAFHRS